MFFFADTRARSLTKGAFPLVRPVWQVEVEDGGPFAAKLDAGNTTSEPFNTLGYECPLEFAVFGYHADQLCGLHSA